MPRTTANDPLLQGLLARFDFDGVAGRIVAGTLPTIPGYARMPDGVMAGAVHEIVKHNLELFVTCVLEDREPSADEMAVLRASAMERGRDGVPLHDMLHGYRLGARVAWHALIDVCTTADEREALLGIAERIMKYLDGVSTAVEESYLDERDHLVSEQERWARALLDALLSPVDADDLPRLAELTSFPLAEAYRPFAVSVLGATAREHAKVAIDLRGRGILALTEGDRVAGLIHPEREPLGVDRRGAASAIGPETPRAQLSEGLAFARLQVQTARTLRRTGVVGAGDLLPELLLARSPEVAAAVRAKVIDPLANYAEKRSTELVRTLETFVACGLDRRATAAELVVHLNTLDYRLRRIEQLTGLRLSDPEDLAMIVLALKQRQLGG